MTSLSSLSPTCHVDSRHPLLWSSQVLPCRRASSRGTVDRQGCRAVSAEFYCPPWHRPHRQHCRLNSWLFQFHRQSIFWDKTIREALRRDRPYHWHDIPPAEPHAIICRHKAAQTLSYTEIHVVHQHDGWRNDNNRTPGLQQNQIRTNWLPIAARAQSSSSSVYWLLVSAASAEADDLLIMSERATIQLCASAVKIVETISIVTHNKSRAIAGRTARCRCKFR